MLLNYVTYSFASGNNNANVIIRPTQHISYYNYYELPYLALYIASCSGGSLLIASLLLTPVSA